MVTYSTAFIRNPHVATLRRAISAAVERESRAMLHRFLQFLRSLTGVIKVWVCLASNL